MRQVYRSLMLLLVLSLAAARDCGQAEIDARDVSGCITVRHVKRIGHGQAVWLGEALHDNADMETLDLHHTSIGDDDALVIASGLRSNTKLHGLAMHNNKITDVGARAIGEALAENHALTSLTLSSNAVSDDGAAGLAEGLKRNKALRHLNLYFNLVGDAGAVALASALHDNHALRTLSLDSNKVGDVGAQALAKALPVNLGLWQLTLVRNTFKNAGALALVAAARDDAQMLQLGVDHNRGVYGEAVDAITAFEPEQKERQALATFLKHNKLADGIAEPAMLSPFAAPVRALRAHHADGLSALRHMDAAALEAHSAMRPLGAAEKDVLVPLLLRLAQEAAMRDEL